MSVYVFSICILEDVCFLKMFTNMNNFTNKISFSRQRVDWFSNMLVCKYWGENLQVAKAPSGCQLQKPHAEEGPPPTAAPHNSEEEDEKEQVERREEGKDGDG